MDLTPITSLIPENVLHILSYIVTFSAAAATVLPKVMDTSTLAYKVIRAIIDTLALNFGNAKNAN